MHVARTGTTVHTIHRILNYCRHFFWRRNKWLWEIYTCWGLVPQPHCLEYSCVRRFTLKNTHSALNYDKIQLFKPDIPFPPAPHPATPTPHTTTNRFYFLFFLFLPWNLFSFPPYFSLLTLSSPFSQFLFLSMPDSWYDFDGWWCVWGVCGCVMIVWARGGWVEH